MLFLALFAMLGSILCAFAAGFHFGCAQTEHGCTNALKKAAWKAGFASCLLFAFAVALLWEL